jgi:membrane-associated phospholipid phosphatase
MKRAAVRSATDPMTWLPLAGSVLLAVTRTDDAVSDWAADKQPLFGDNADDVSDKLLDLTTASYFVTALLAPSASISDKAKGLGVGIGAIYLNRGITDGLKSVTNRERPDRTNDRSFPSGHASSSSVRATLAAENLAYLPLPDWAAGSLTVGLYCVAGGTAWARVEAEKHHVTDVLAGNALGHFVATFMQEAFMEAGVKDLSVEFVPAGRGGSVTLRLALGR